MDPLVSAVIPTYNREEYVSAAIDSVLDRTSSTDTRSTTACG
jgi:glycosyltransferase involved in cell wall biosynthesis